MIQTMKKYPAYKDSGEHWMGDIPTHWSIKRLKHIFQEKKKVTNPSLGCGSISFGKVVYKDDDKMPISTKASYQEVLAGEFLINPLNLNYDLISLRIGLSDINVVVSSGYIVLKSVIKLDKSYFNYLLHRYDVAYMKLLGSGVRQTISFNHIANSLLAFPPLQEQTSIANFLDNKTSKIDTAIAQKEQMIALLKERKQIVIQNAVTGKWSMVDGKWAETPKEKMKDSGVEWLREIPEGWEVKRIKHLYKIGRGRVIAQTELIDGAPFPVYSSQTKDDGILGYINAYDFDCEQITWTTDGANAGTIFIRKGKHNCTNVCGTLQANSKSIINKFNKYALEVSSPHYKRPDTNGAKIMNNEMAEIFIVQPTLEEQTAIATFLDDKTSKIDTAITLQQTQIEKLKEYKATLIDSAVTGKIRVSD